jgi:hypothetical protein
MADSGCSQFAACDLTAGADWPRAWTPERKQAMTAPGKTSSRGVEDESPPHGISSPGPDGASEIHPAAMEHQPGLGWITDPYGHYREIGKPPGTASRNYALSLMAQVISSQRWGCPGQLAGQSDRARQNGWLPAPRTAGAFTENLIGVLPAPSAKQLTGRVSRRQLTVQSDAPPCISGHSASAAGVPLLASCLMDGRRDVPGLAVVQAGHLELSQCGSPQITLAAAKARPIRLRKAPHVNSLGHRYF